MSAPDNNFQLLFEASPNPCLIIAPDFKITAVNDAYLAATGTERDAITGHSLLEVFTNKVDVMPEAVLKLKTSLHDVLKHKLPHAIAVQKYDIQRPGGVIESRYWGIQHTPVFNKKREVISIIHTITDVTGRYSSEEKLLKSEKDYKLLVNSVKDYAIFMVDINGCVASWNEGAERIKGYTSAEIIGKPIGIFYKVEDVKNKEPEHMLQLALKHGSYETEGWRVRKDGRLIYANIVITALLDENGSLYGYAKVTKDITEKWKADERIRFLASIANNIKDPVISADNDFVITGWNEAAENLLEWKAAEAIGKTTPEILKTDYPAQSREQILALFSAKGFWEGEVIYYTKSGRPLTVISTASKLKNADGIITGNLVLVRDITERVKAEQQLKEFEHFFNNSNDISCIANSDGYFEIVNQAFKKVLGYCENEFSQKPFIDFVHPDDITATIQEYDRLKNGATVIHFLNRYRKNDGSYRWFEWNATPNAATGKIYCIARDITDRMKAEQALTRLNEELEHKIEERTAAIKKSEKKYRHLFDNNPMPMWVIDESSFKFLDVNKKAVENYGYSREEFLAMTAVDIRPEEEKNIFTVGAFTVEKNKTAKQTRTWSHLKKDGTVIKVEINSIPIAFENYKARLIISNDVTEKLLVQEKLSYSEKRFRALVENNNDLIVLTDTSFRIIYRSPSASRTTGWDNADMEYTDFTKNIHPEDQEKVKNIFRLVAARQGKIATITYRSRHKDGHYLYIEGRMANMLHEDHINAIVLNLHDVTKRKKLEQLLNKANTLARIGGWEVDMIKGTVYWSDITREIHQAERDYVPDLASGLNFYKKGAGRELMEQKVSEAIESGKPWDVELQIITARQHERWIRSIGETEFADGKCVKIYGSFQDIDERKKAEERLAHSEARFRTLIENISDAIVLNDAASNILYQSPSVTRILGYSPEERNGKKVIDYVYPDDKDDFINFYEALKNTPNVPLSFQYRFRHKHGHYIWLEGVVTNLLDDPVVNAYVCNYRDITERKEAEREITELNSALEEKVALRTLQLQKSNQELEAFSYSVSHDLRAPLRGIIGFTSILEEDYGSRLDKEAGRLMGIIKNNTLKMGNLIDDLLAFSKIAQHQVDKMVFNSSELVNLVVSAFEKEKIEWEISPLQQTYGDYNTIRQVWVNLISNAVKYSSHTEHPTITIGSYDENNTHTVFFVRDNGVGFDEKYADKLFKVFQRLHADSEFEGTGIGLAIVEKIISKHGGKVWAKAAIGKGACFYFSLPNQINNTI